MPSTLDGIMDEIAAVIQAVNGVGKVHAGFTYTQDEKQAMDLYSDGGVINTWILSRENTPSKWHTSRIRFDHHKIVVNAYYAMQKDLGQPVNREKEFQLLVEAVRDAFDDAIVCRLNGEGHIREAVQADAVDQVMFLNTFLCWHARLSMKVENF